MFKFFFVALLAIGVLMDVSSANTEDHVDFGFDDGGYVDLHDWTDEFEFVDFGQDADYELPTD